MSNDLIEADKETPIPENSGSDGDQEAKSPQDVEVISTRGDLPIGDAVRGISSSGIRAFSSEALSKLYTGITNQLERDLVQTRQELTNCSDKREKLRDDLATAQIENGILTERINSYKENRHLPNILIAVGGGLLGIGIDFLREESWIIGLGIAVLGVFAICVGWFSSPRGGKNGL